MDGSDRVFICPQDGDYIVEQIVDDETNCTAKIEDDSIEGRDGTISKPIKEYQNESIDSSEEHNEASGDELNKDIYLLENTRDGNNSDIVMEETKLSVFSVENLPWKAIKPENNDPEEESPFSSVNNQSEVDQSEAENTEDESSLHSDNSQAEVDQSEAENTEAESPLNIASSQAEVDQSEVENTEVESPLNSDNSHAEVDQSEAENTEDESVGIFNECLKPNDENNLSSVEDIVQTVIKGGSRSASSELYDPTEVKLDSIDVIVLVEEVNESEIEDISTTEKEEASPIIINKGVQVRKSISDTENDSINELEDCYTKLKKTVRRNKTKKDSEDARDFNP